MENTNNQTECCPRLDPVLWDGKIIEWDNKKFIREKVRTFFYMPVNFGCVMKRAVQKIESSDASMPQSMCLSDHTSKWNMNVYIDVDKIISGADNVMITGKFLCKVYEGDFKETGKWCKDFEEYAKSQSFDILKWYMWYTTCPKCAKKYGKNYVVILGKIA